MRAKFVPAEMLYPQAAQVPSPVNTEMPPPPSYGMVDYSAFSQPPNSNNGSTFGTQEPVFETNSKSQSGFNNDFALSPFDANQLDGFGNDKFFSAFSFESNGHAEKNGNNSKRMPSASTKDSPHASGSFTETSKFGFNYEPLSENLEELELTSNNKSTKEKFDKAKFEIEIGNHYEGNRILKEMLDKEEIRYSSSHYFDKNHHHS